ncbi:hypothetical protein K437DRAFT_158118 [Tilletiaria anomala UBC 951]|uniref:Uncharacterized protein n=1 Tax=Tilletiaria anomala (strain ATCC 24038 / CBS 436.72 / UBC 951) TaxID=1037660 RepID=A0A066VLX2_TILAU|nr:uncharacterized protein K437DRAFT_158118 [Tilletiaria anomala UBC 951]KDN42742.1 hypothetical protein K437DRAFT_158118 [Tilletiaria anomala UBC 951]
MAATNEERAERLARRSSRQAQPISTSQTSTSNEAAASGTRNRWTQGTSPPPSDATVLTVLRQGDEPMQQTHLAMIRLVQQQIETVQQQTETLSSLVQQQNEILQQRAEASTRLVQQHVETLSRLMQHQEEHSTACTQLRAENEHRFMSMLSAMSSILEALGQRAQETHMVNTARTPSEGHSLQQNARSEPPPVDEPMAAPSRSWDELQPLEGGPDSYDAFVDGTDAPGPPRTTSIPLGDGNLPGRGAVPLSEEQAQVFGGDAPSSEDRQASAYPQTSNEISGEDGGDDDDDEISDNDAEFTSSANDDQSFAHMLRISNEEKTALRLIREESRPDALARVKEAVRPHGHRLYIRRTRGRNSPCLMLCHRGGARAGRTRTNKGSCPFSITLHRADSVWRVHIDNAYHESSLCGQADVLHPRLSLSERDEIERMDEAGVRPQRIRELVNQAREHQGIPPIQKAKTFSNALERYRRQRRLEKSHDMGTFSGGAAANPQT